MLQRDDLLEVADSVLAPGMPAVDVRQRQKTWISLLVLNAVYMDYLGAKSGFHSGEALETIRESLKTFLKSDVTFQITQNPGAYDDEFRKMCRETRQLILPESTVAP